MAGLREKTKKQNQKKIIQSAKKMFMEKGFHDVSMTEIATDAEVGTGTIYNYFASKRTLLLTVFTDEMANIQKSHHIMITDDNGLFIEDIMRLLDEFSVFFHRYSKSFWRELMPVITETEGNNHLRQDVFDLDEKMMGWIEQIVSKHMDQFLISVDSKEAARVIYSIVITQTFLFVYDDATTYHEFLKRLQRKIEFVFSGKVKD